MTDRTSMERSRRSGQTGDLAETGAGGLEPILASSLLALVLGGAAFACARRHRLLTR